jgi:hypothetical protein
MSRVESGGELLGPCRLGRNKVVFIVLFLQSGIYNISCPGEIRRIFDLRPDEILGAPRLDIWDAIARNSVILPRRRYFRNRLIRNFPPDRAAMRLPSRRPTGSLEHESSKTPSPL